MFQAGSLKYNSDYHFARDESDDELNPSAIFYSTGHLYPRRPFYTVVPKPITFGDNKMTVGGFLINKVARSIVILRYVPENGAHYNIPVTDAISTELFGWGKWIQGDGKSIIDHTDDSHEDRPIVPPLKNDEFVLLVRGCILDEMRNRLDGFHIEPAETRDDIFYVTDEASEARDISLESLVLYAVII